MTIQSQQKKEKRKMESPRHTLVTYILVVVSIFIISSQLIITHFLAGLGASLSTLEEKTSLIKRENQEVKANIQSRLSLLEIENSSKALGFAKPGSVIYIDTTGIGTVARAPF